MFFFADSFSRDGCAVLRWRRHVAGVGHTGPDARHAAAMQFRMIINKQKASSAAERLHTDGG